MRRALASLSAVEQADILDTLLSAHPELATEAESLAVGTLENAGRDAVAIEVADGLRRLHISDLAGRAGKVPGGYVEPHEAADDLLRKVVDPFLDDLRRRARLVAIDAATEIGLGLVSGLYRCRDEDDDDRVLTHAGLPDAADELAAEVLQAMTAAGLDMPHGWLAQTCPALYQP